MSEQLTEPRNFAIGLLTAREMGDSARYQALYALAEEHGEPTWDRARGEFYYSFGLGEPYPRGQANAVIMAAEAGGEPAGGGGCNRPDQRKVDPPTVSWAHAPRPRILHTLYA